MVWLITPLLTVEYQWVLAAEGGGDSTNIPGSEPSL